jgi:hypothetical protein
VEDPADLGLAVLDAAEKDGDVTEEQAVLLALDGEDDPVVVALQPGRRDPALEDRFDLLAGRRLPVEVSRHLGQGLHRGQAVKVTLPEAAEQQALGADLAFGQVHRRTQPSVTWKILRRSSWTVQVVRSPAWRRPTSPGPTSSVGPRSTLPSAAVSRLSLRSITRAS